MIPREVVDATGKNRESLAKSRQRRDDILREFRGELPMSVMAAERVKRKHDPASGSYRTSSKVDPDSDLATVFDVSGQSTRSGALSMFPQNIGRAVLLLYSNEGDLVLDPFAGHNSRMELCVKENRRYVGYDISAEFMAYNRKRAGELWAAGDAPIFLHECDSRLLAWTTTESADFTLTSPPYWDIEFYGDEAEQLGKAKTYAEFCHDLGLVAKENYRGLKHGAFCVWFINDFRRKGKFYRYHVDVWALLIDAGFEVWDIMIVDLGYPIRAAFAGQIIDQKILPKRHEYGLVMRKP